MNINPTKTSMTPEETKEYQHKYWLARKHDPEDIRKRRAYRRKYYLKHREEIIADMTQRYYKRKQA